MKYLYVLEPDEGEAGDESVQQILDLIKKVKSTQESATVTQQTISEQMDSRLDNLQGQITRIDNKVESL